MNRLAAKNRHHLDMCPSQAVRRPAGLGHAQRAPTARSAGLRRAPRVGCRRGTAAPCPFSLRTMARGFLAGARSGRRRWCRTTRPSAVTIVAARSPSAEMEARSIATGKVMRAKCSPSVDRSTRPARPMSQQMVEVGAAPRVSAPRGASTATGVQGPSAPIARRTSPLGRIRQCTTAGDTRARVGGAAPPPRAPPRFWPTGLAGAGGDENSIAAPSPVALAAAPTETASAPARWNVIRSGFDPTVGGAAVTCTGDEAVDATGRSAAAGGGAAGGGGGKVVGAAAAGGIDGAGGGGAAAGGGAAMVAAGVAGGRAAAPVGPGSGRCSAAAVCVCGGVGAAPDDCGAGGGVATIGAGACAVILAAAGGVACACGHTTQTSREAASALAATGTIQRQA